MWRAGRAIGVVMPRHEYEIVASRRNEWSYPFLLGNNIGTGKRGRGEAGNVSPCRTSATPL